MLNDLPRAMFPFRPCGFRLPISDSTPCRSPRKLVTNDHDPLILTIPKFLIPGYPLRKARFSTEVIPTIGSVPEAVCVIQPIHHSV